MANLSQLPPSPEQRLDYLRRKGYSIHKWWFENHVTHVVIFFSDLRGKKRAHLPTICRGLNLQLIPGRKFTTRPDTCRSDWYSLWEVNHKYEISRDQFKALVEARGLPVLCKKHGEVFKKVEGYYVLVRDVETLQLSLRPSEQSI